MRLFFTFCVVIPSLLSAQLDRIKPGMTESVFIQKVVGAERDYEKESYWIVANDTLGEFLGESKWRTRRDSISEYHFRSELICGPSANYPGVDSFDVHLMKLELNKLKSVFENNLGKPILGFDTPLNEFGAADQDVFCYVVVWLMPKGKKVRLTLRRDVPIVAPNGMVDDRTPNCELYYIEISVESAQESLRQTYGIGMSNAEFIKAFPWYGAFLNVKDLHFYSLPDSATCRNAGWSFTFAEEKLVAFSYNAYYGTAYGSKSDEEAYFKLKNPTERIVREGNAAFGLPDTMSNALVNIYQVRDFQWTFTINHLYCEWKTKSGRIYMEFVETGGGKNPATTFEVSVVFKEEE